MSLVLYSNHDEAKMTLAYLYDILKNSEVSQANLKGIYLDCDKDYVRDYNRKGEKQFFHFIIPENGSYSINNINITIKDYVINDEVAVVKNKESLYPIKEIFMTAENNEIIKAFIEKAINIKQKEIKELNSSSNDKIKKKVYSKYGWLNHSSIPKRQLNTIFLKEGQIDNIKEKILTFINEDSYKDYVKHGIPYKMNVLLHGTPGVGKTSLIHSIASLCNADICMLNINEELKENDMIDAFRSVHDDDKLAIVVIEDIDCIFTDRKSYDTHKNHITLNGLLNCLDGFNNQEGLILILTTNFPDKLDEALLRSGRIDLEIELTFLDKFQAKNMFLSFFNDEKAFETLWAQINKYNVEPSTFLQFLFNNRKSSDISIHFKDFLNILYKKSQKSCSMYT
jgi:ATP-dependent 26S proteasome regulatory subunit